MYKAGRVERGEGQVQHMSKVLSVQGNKDDAVKDKPSDVKYCKVLVGDGEPRLVTPFTWK